MFSSMEMDSSWNSGRTLAARNSRCSQKLSKVQASQNTWSGTLAWGNVSFNTTSGAHEYKWCYTKDFTGSSGTDEAWVDNISIISIPPDLSVVVNSATSYGTNVTINYTVTNNTNIPVGAFVVDFWSDALSPVVGDTGET